MPKTPSYRKRGGRTQAIVTLTDSVSKKRRDYWLGQHGTPERAIGEGTRQGLASTINWARPSSHH